MHRFLRFYYAATLADLCNSIQRGGVGKSEYEKRKKTKLETITPISWYLGCNDIKKGVWDV